MIEPEELADAPDYKWRRWWARASIPLTAILFMVVLGLSQNVFMALLAAGVVYAAVSAKVRDLDAWRQGAPSPDFDAVVQAALERRRLEDGAEPMAPTQPGEDGATTAPSRSARPASPGFGRATPTPADTSSPRRPVQLPRHRG